jgi:formate dehydrogenase major subunit
MKVTRRQFLKVTGATVATFAVVDLGFDLSTTASEIKDLRTNGVKPVPSICPFCGAGCGLVVYAKEGAPADGPQILSIQGDPDNPINRGGACSKGSALMNLREIYNPETGKQEINPKRITKPLYRKPGSLKWEEKDWDWMLNTIAERIKETRDKYFEHKDKQGIIVNRCEKIASMGGAALDNEELHLITKMNRALGLTYIEHQARI